MLVEKFVYHTPLYRQHQKLADEGIVVSRTTLDNWGREAIELLEPIAQAVRQAIVSGSRRKVDETPIKAGRTKDASGQGKMKQGWLWPVLLGEHYRGTLQTDGYQVYAAYAAALPDCTHALCCARRALLKAEKMDPQPVAQALEMIRALYAIEKRLRQAGPAQGAILAARRAVHKAMPGPPAQRT